MLSDRMQTCFLHTEISSLFWSPPGEIHYPTQLHHLQAVVAVFEAALAGCASAGCVLNLFLVASEGLQLPACRSSTDSCLLTLHACRCLAGHCHVCHCRLTCYYVLGLAELPARHNTCRIVPWCLTLTSLALIASPRALSMYSLLVMTAFGLPRYWKIQSRGAANIPQPAKTRKRIHPAYQQYV